MRILVLSDSHLRLFLFESVLLREPDAAVVFHLGDGAGHLLPTARTDGRPFLLLRGNCDREQPGLLDTVDTELFGKRVYAAHGHRSGVKYGIDKFAVEARLHNADLALFGHTHQPCCIYRDGMYLFNPGALQDGYYGILDITPQGVLCTHKEIGI